MQFSAALLALLPAAVVGSPIVNNLPGGLNIPTGLPTGLPHIPTGFPTGLPTGHPTIPMPTPSLPPKPTYPAHPPKPTYSMIPKPTGKPSVPGVCIGGLGLPMSCQMPNGNAWFCGECQQPGQGCEVSFPHGSTLDSQPLCALLAPAFGQPRF